MSAFMVNDLTINRILSFFFWNKETFLRSDIKRILGKIGFSVEKTQELGEAIIILNMESMKERYGERCLEKDDIRFTEYNNINHKVSIEQALQHLKCLTYQCCEGKCDQDKLYLALQEIEDDMAHTIANREIEKLGCEWEAKE